MYMREENTILVKSKAFAVRIVRMYKWLTQEQKEFVLSTQCLRSGTSIGANVHEGVLARSKSEFIAKLQISIKEANETKYWLEILRETEFLTEEMYDSIYPECIELIKLLVSIVKSANKSLNQ